MFSIQDQALVLQTPRQTHIWEKKKPLSSRKEDRGLSITGKHKNKSFSLPTNTSAAAHKGDTSVAATRFKPSGTKGVLFVI